MPQLLLDGREPILCQPDSTTTELTDCVYPNHNVGEWREAATTWTFLGYYDGQIWRYTVAGFAFHGTQPASPAAPSPVIALAPSPLLGNLTLSAIDGKATLVAHDGTYLGKISSSSSDPDSICTDWGLYGSTWGVHSVRTDWGIYGADWSARSAYTTWTSTPPLIIYDKRTVGYLTKNTSLTGAVDPDVLFAVYGCAR